MALKENEAYYTKYAFSDGILIVTTSESTLKGYVRVKGERYLSDAVPVSLVHTSWESAMEQVEKMRIKKLASLSKQMKKVQEKTFTEPE